MTRRRTTIDPLGGFTVFGDPGGVVGRDCATPPCKACVGAKLPGDISVSDACESITNLPLNMYVEGHDFNATSYNPWCPPDPATTLSTYVKTGVGGGTFRVGYVLDELNEAFSANCAPTYTGSTTGVGGVVTHHWRDVDNYTAGTVVVTCDYTPIDNTRFNVEALLSFHECTLGLTLSYTCAVLPAGSGVYRSTASVRYDGAVILTPTHVSDGYVDISVAETIDELTIGNSRSIVRVLLEGTV